MKSLFKALLFYPEAIFDHWVGKLTAYFLLYIFPFFLVISSIASFIVYGAGPITIFVFLLFVAGYSGVMFRVMYLYYGKVTLSKAAVKPLPKRVKRYFDQSYPGVYLPIRVSQDKSIWVAYGIHPKIDMARTITYLDYYLMPPVKRFKEFYMDHIDCIKYQYLTVIDAEREEFYLSDQKTANSYPVTVFDKDDITR